MELHLKKSKSDYTLSQICVLKSKGLYLLKTKKLHRRRQAKKSNFHIDKSKFHDKAEPNILTT